MQPHLPHLSGHLLSASTSETPSNILRKLHTPALLEAMQSLLHLNLIPSQRHPHGPDRRSLNAWRQTQLTCRLRTWSAFCTARLLFSL